MRIVINYIFYNTTVLYIFQQLPLLRVTAVKNCGTNHDPIQLKTLALPSVIDLKSSFNFSIDAVLHQQLKAPLKVGVIVIPS